MLAPTEFGKLIENATGQRDAVHVPCFEARLPQSSYSLVPGQPVKPSDAHAIMDGRAVFVERCFPDQMIGVIDPFLLSPVCPGDYFWVWLRPGNIQDLRHVWTHPAFDDAPPADPADTAISEDDSSANEPKRQGGMELGADGIVRVYEPGRLSGTDMSREQYDVLDKAMAEMNRVAQEAYNDGQPYSIRPGKVTVAQLLVKAREDVDQGYEEANIAVPEAYPTDRLHAMRHDVRAVLQDVLGKPVPRFEFVCGC